uniref:Uncharacterized protein n=1 Tax=Heterorhabditis bacteriophora TaxID=37862 RepID=A0A1I7WNG3_HETBA
MRIVFLTCVTAILGCEVGQRFRQGSFYKECISPNELRRTGCFADWLWGDGVYVPFNTLVDHMLHNDMGYRFACISNGRTHSFQIIVKFITIHLSACLFRDPNNLVRELKIGSKSTIYHRNGRSTNFYCKP